MAKRLAKFKLEIIVGNRQSGWTEEAKCLDYPITRRVHTTRTGKTFRQYFIPKRKYLGYLDGFPNLKLAIGALHEKNHGRH